MPRQPSLCSIQEVVNGGARHSNMLPDARSKMLKVVIASSEKEEDATLPL